MMTTLPGQDTLPWYRQFWPWFLIALPASVVVAGLTTVYIANKHADDLVVDDYYKDGMAINQQLEKKNRAAELGISAKLAFSKHSIAVTVTGGISNNILYLGLSHPLEADQDFALELRPVEPGFYAGILPRKIFARWHWTLENRADPAWRLDGTVGQKNSVDASSH